MYYNTLGFQMNAKCYANCSMCYLSCNGNGSEGLPMTLITELIKQASHQRHMKHIAFSGGDPFLRYNDLIHAIKIAKECGFETSCFTNAFWCKSTEETEKRINELVDAGLDTLRISLDYQHAKHIPIDRYKTLLCMLKETKIKVYLNVGVLNDVKDKTFELLNELRTCLLNYDVIIFPFMRIGRAENLPENYFYRTIQKTKLMCPRNTILPIRANGDVFPCDMCPPNFAPVGNAYVHSLNELISNAYKNKFHRLVQKRGLPWIVNMIDNYKGKIVPSVFTAPCEFCKWLREQPGLIEEVILLEEEHTNG